MGTAKSCCGRAVVARFAGRRGAWRCGHEGEPGVTAATRSGASAGGAGRGTAATDSATAVHGAAVACRVGVGERSGTGLAHAGGRDGLSAGSALLQLACAPRRMQTLPSG